MMRGEVVEAPAAPAAVLMIVPLLATSDSTSFDNGSTSISVTSTGASFDDASRSVSVIVENNNFTPELQTDAMLLLMKSLFYQRAQSMRTNRIVRREDPLYRSP
jgi:hypothetical protein